MESLTRPAHRRKLSNASGVFSFSSKNAYDDVFAAPVSSLPKFKPPSGVEDYGEIFAGGSRGSSIPVLDLSALGEPEGFRSSKLDYTKIFGGFGDEDIAVPYEELLKNSANKGKCSSDKAKRNQVVKESPLRGPDNCALSGKNKVLSSEASDQSTDRMKQVNMSYHKTSQRSKDGTSGTTHVAKLHAVPGFTHFVDEASRQRKTEGDRPLPSIQSEVHPTWSFSGDIHEENNGRKTETHMPDKLTSESVVRGKRGSWRDGSNSSDKVFNAKEINLKSCSVKSSPSSSPPAKQNDDSKGHAEQLKSSNFASKANPFENTAGDYLTGSDEEIDINSAAAASAAALKKAIEKAQESIRLAKELMERKKDGLQGLSKPSSEGNFKVKDKKVSRIDQEAISIKENNAKETCQSFDHVLQGFTEINRRVISRSDEVAPTFEHSKKFSTSREVEMEKHQGDVREVHAEATWLSNLVNSVKHKITTLASGQIANKSTLLQSMNKQACDLDEMETAEETLERVENNVEETKEIEKDFELVNAENKVIIDQCVQESEETINKSDAAPIIREYGESENLKSTGEDILAENIQNGFDKQGNEKKLGERLDMTEEENLEPLISENDYMLKESNNLVKEEKELFEAFQQVRIGTKSEDVHALEENDYELGNSCHGGGWMAQEEALLFVETDDKPTEGCGSGSCEKTYKDDQEEEDSDISDIVQEREIDEMELIHAANGEETRRITEEELEGKELEELDLNEKETIHSPAEEKSEKTLKEEHEGEEVQKQPEETNNYLEAVKIPEEEFDWEEVEKRIKEACINEATESMSRKPDKSAENQNEEVIQEAEEAKSTQFKAGNLANNQEIDFLQKSDCERDSDTASDANTSLHEVQEAWTFEISMKTSQDAVGNREDNRSTPGSTEAFYTCEVDVNKVEKSDKEASELEDKMFQSPYQEHLSPSEMPSASKAVDFDEDGANVHHNEMNHAHKVCKENALETADLVQNAVKENDINIKMQDFSEAYPRDEKATDIGSCENSRQKVMEENVKESGGGLVHKSRENPENVKQTEIVFDKEEEKIDLKVLHQERNMEEDLKKAESTPLASQSTVNWKSVEPDKEMRTGQNIENSEKYLHETVVMELKDTRETLRKEVKEKDNSRNIEAIRKEREREKDRIAVERAIREARERAFAEARERAERAAVERAAAEVRQRVMAEAREKLEKATTGSKLADKASTEAKLRVERAAVERATAEARERALEKALSQKSTAEAEKFSGASRYNGLKHSYSSSDLERSDGTNSESAQRRKARLERHQRIMERVEKALAEKNKRDLLAEKEQAERNRLAESLDADIKRWASGKEGNLRALLSTLQYILGPDSGWQPIPLSEIVTTAAVKKAYRKATLYVHPDKLQQRGASIRQKYICEKVFDLLKDGACAFAKAS